MVKAFKESHENDVERLTSDRRMLRDWLFTVDMDKTLLERRGLEIGINNSNTINLFQLILDLQKLE